MSASAEVSDWLWQQHRIDGSLTHFSIADHGVSVICSTKLLKIMLEDLLSPCFGTSGKVDVAQIFVHDRSLPSWIVSALKSGKSIPLRIFGKNGTKSQNDEYGRVLDMRYNARAILMSEQSICCVWPTKNKVFVIGKNPVQSAQLVIKELLRTSIWPSVVHLHAAAVSIDNCGILFVGAKGAGKTTLSLSSCLLNDAAYISNDRTIIGRSEETIVTVGWPSRIRIAPDTLNLEPFTGSNVTQQIRSMATVRMDKYELQPGELGSLGVLVQKKPVPVCTCIFPKLVDDTSIPFIEEYRVEKLSADDVLQRLQQNSLSWPEKNWPHWTEWFTDHRTNPDTKKILLELAENVPGYQLSVKKGISWPLEKIFTKIIAPE